MGHGGDVAFASPRSGRDEPVQDPARIQGREIFCHPRRARSVADRAGRATSRLSRRLGPAGTILGVILDKGQKLYFNSAALHATLLRAPVLKGHRYRCDQVTSQVMSMRQ